MSFPSTRTRRKPFRVSALLRSAAETGGKLIVATPNQGSFIQYAPGPLLNIPPHHLTRWVGQTYATLEKLLPLKLRTIRYEPLASLHTGWAAECWVNMLAGANRKTSRDSLKRPPLSNLILFKAANWGGKIALHWRLLRNRIRGHSIFVVFEKY